ncbi:MAG TPA: HlyD family efflux transporter periplasmic adaptor subunit [Fibrobacteria bacterium]|nr:HlyD family efflux transporter periplasmic adaptor subunit [Fibrobacteria bacterium]
MGKRSGSHAGGTAGTGGAVLFSGALAGLLIGCGGRTDPDFIGSAIVEAQTYQVSAMTQGKLVGLYKQEGQDVSAGELLAVVDTVPYFLQLQEAQGGLAELVAGMRSRENDLKAAQAEIHGLEKDYARITPLVEEGSLPPQQGDRLASSLDAARAKYSSGKDMLESLGGKRQGLEARMGQIREQLQHCYLRAPASGRVLTRYKNPDETAAPGQPVYEIGQEDTLRVDFFVPQTWLAGLKYGQPVRLRLDTENGKDGVFLPATISWIGHEAEFSPKNIQTRESRNELVFRVRALAANKDGMLKRGLPVEVWKAE